MSPSGAVVKKLEAVVYGGLLAGRRATPSHYLVPSQEQWICFYCGLYHQATSQSAGFLSPSDMDGGEFRVSPAQAPTLLRFAGNAVQNTPEKA